MATYCRDAPPSKRKLHQMDMETVPALQKPGRRDECERQLLIPPNVMTELGCTVPTTSGMPSSNDTDIVGDTHWRHIVSSAA